MPTAIIAEDEPLLARALADELARAWPELTIAATVGDGQSAIDAALRENPDVLFFDIRMPGMDGLSAAAELADVWPSAQTALPLLVFVTAYDQYAVQAFEAQALDYVLKPVQPERLARTVTRLRQALTHESLEDSLTRWRALLDAAHGGGQVSAKLRTINAADLGGSNVNVIPIDQILYFEAADKYVRVLTADSEYLIRTPLRQLTAQLDRDQFWQVHRAILVQANAIRRVQRDETGRLHLQLHERPERLPVSRLYAHLFRAM